MNQINQSAFKKPNPFIKRRKYTISCITHHNQYLLLILARKFQEITLLLSTNRDKIIDPWSAAPLRNSSPVNNENLYF